jgi:hypothetical protein
MYVMNVLREIAALLNFPCPPSHALAAARWNWLTWQVLQIQRAAARAAPTRFNDFINLAVFCELVFLD